MSSATAALQSLEAHRRVLDKERHEMKDDIAFLRDLRRRYTLPLSELPPCKGLPAPVASSARKFLVDTEAYIMRRISANQKQDVEIANNADQLRGTIEQTAQIAHRIAGTTPTAYSAPPGAPFHGGYNHNNNNNGYNPSFGFNNNNNGGGVGSSSNISGYNNNGAGITNIQTPGGGGAINYGAPQMQQGQAPTIGFNEPLTTMASSPGGASRYTGGGGGGGGAASNRSGVSPMPNYANNNNSGNIQASQYQRPSGGTTEIGFEAPLGVLPYMTAASAAYRQQQALAYLAADQGVLPKGWAPAPLHPQNIGNYGNNAGTGHYGGGRNGGGNGNVSPSRMRAMEMSGFGGGAGGNGEGTTFVVLPRENSKERARAASTSKRASSASRK